MTLKAYVISVSIITFSFGCGGSSKDTVSTVPAISSTVTVTISPSSASVQSGASQQFSASVRGTADPSIEWRVNNVPGGTSQTGIIGASGLYASPALQFTSSTVTISAVSRADASRSASAQLMIEAAHRIGTSQSSGLGQFTDRQTGAEFLIRGNHYIRLASQQALPLPGGTVVYHSTFNVGTYDAVQAESALKQMAEVDKYNAVSVFLNGCCANSLQGPTTLNAAYVANVVDFLRRANAHGIYVILAMDPVTFPPYGNAFFQSCCGRSLIDGVNLQALSQGGIDAPTSFWSDFLHEAVNQHAPLNIVLGYLVTQEFYYDAAMPPLSLSSGFVTTANGKIYNMADQAFQAGDDG